MAGACLKLSGNIECWCVLLRYERNFCPVCHSQSQQNPSTESALWRTVRRATQGSFYANTNNKNSLGEPLLHEGNWTRCGNEECGHEYCIFHGDAHPRDVSCAEFERRNLSEETMPTTGCSLLVKVLGIYKVRLHPLQSDVYFMVMENLGKGLHPRAKFDLKGSNNAAKLNQVTLRDRDLRQLQGLGEIDFSITNRASFVEKMQGDASFLRELGMMDYSLLVFVLKPEEQSLRELRRFLTNYQREVHTLASTLEGLFGKTRVVSTMVERLDETYRDLEQRSALLERGVSPQDDLNGHDLKRQLVNDSIGHITAESRAVCLQVLANIKQLDDCDGARVCNDACVSCLIRKAGQFKQFKTHHMLATHRASVRALSETLENILLRESVTLSRGALLADSVVGTCNFRGAPCELACCIIDLASRWDLKSRLTEIGKMATKSGGATGWLRCNDWGISAKNPHTYMLRFLRSMEEYFGLEILTDRDGDAIERSYQEIIQSGTGEGLPNQIHMWRGSSGSNQQGSMTPGTSSLLEMQARHFESHLSWENVLDSCQGACAETDNAWSRDFDSSTLSQSTRRQNTATSQNDPQAQEALRAVGEYYLQ